jgi:tetratricopeptide (TPR) repeat protein
LAQSRGSAEPAERALVRKTLRSPVDRAQIQLLHAQLRGDAAEASQARAVLVRLLPRDTAVLRKFADEETNARNFAQAVRFYQALLNAGTGDPTVGNLLGYAQFYAGDLAGARKSFEAYGRLPGQAANALDSQGEVLFMAGQFKEAEQLFLRAHELSPMMLAGDDLLKAAYARWLGGDLAGADGIFERYLKYRSDNSDINESYRRSSWRQATGREAVVRQNSPINLDVLQQAYRATPPASDGMVRVLLAQALLKAGRREEAERLAALWPLPEPGDKEQPLLYPLYLELKKNLSK